LTVWVVLIFQSRKFPNLVMRNKDVFWAIRSYQRRLTMQRLACPLVNNWTSPISEMNGKDSIIAFLHNEAVEVPLKENIIKALKIKGKATKR
jgi:spore germination protein YaaH